MIRESYRIEPDEIKMSKIKWCEESGMISKEDKSDKEHEDIRCMESGLQDI